MLNMNQLRCFYEVAKNLSFSRAADNLFVSQPAVSTQIKLFEDYLNLKVFRRKQGEILLTDVGEKIYTYVLRIFELERQLEDVISDFQKFIKISLRIGTTKTYARFLMPIILKPFSEAFPEVTIELDEGSSLNMSNSLLNFKNSLAIVSKVEENPDIIFRPLMFEEVILIASSTDSLSKKNNIKLTEIENRPIILKEYGSGTYKVVMENLAKEGLKLNIIAKTSNMEFIKELVKQEQAIAFVVKASVQKEINEGSLVAIPIKNHTFLLEIYIAYLRDYELPKAAKAFLYHIDEYIQLWLRSTIP